MERAARGSVLDHVSAVALFISPTSEAAVSRGFTHLPYSALLKPAIMSRDIVQSTPIAQPSDRVVSSCHKACHKVRVARRCAARLMHASGHAAASAIKAQ